MPKEVRLLLDLFDLPDGELLRTVKTRRIFSMNRILTIGSVALLMLASMHMASLAQAPAKASGVLSVLHAGQAATLTDTPAGFEISIFANEKSQLSHEVVEVGSDFVVVRDATKIRETRIPLWSVKAVVVISTGVKGE